MRRSLLVIPVALILGGAGVLGGAGLAVPAAEERTELGEGLVYKAAAAMARHGILLRISGLSTNGLSFHATALELVSRMGAARLRSVDAHMGMVPTWSGFKPAVGVHALRAAVVPHSGAAAHASSAGAGLHGYPIDLSLDIAQLIMARPFGSKAVRLGESSSRAFPAVALSTDVSSRPGELVAHVVTGRDNWRVLATVVKHGSEISGSITAPDVPMTFVRALGLAPKKLQIESGAAHAIIDFERDGDAVYVKMAGRADSICLEHHRLGEGRACGIAVSGAARMAMAGDDIYIDDAIAHLNGVDVRARGHVPRHRDGDFDFTLQVPAQPAQRVLAAIPKAWRTGLFGMELGGDFSATLQLHGRGEDLSIAPEFHFTNMRVLKAPASQDPRALAGAVAWTLTFPYGIPRTTYLGRGSGSFVPSVEVPSLLREAIRVSEDANFYGHDGFDRSEISNALTDLKDGGVARGASTLTQQLAKNLFFDGERNLSRKIEEAIITAALEASLSKNRMMEIYTNVVEWGDGVYGIGPASRHYFGKAPGDLTPREIIFLAGILPAPRRVDRDMKHGGTSAFAEKRVLRVTRMLCSIDKLPASECETDSGAVDTVLASAAQIAP